MNPFHGRGGEAGDRTEIQRAISLLAGHGGVVELRILHAEKAGTVSGYFDSEHWQALAEEAFRWSGLAPAVYVTLNPVHRDLMARASNRAKPFAKETTADADILRRFWFMIDFDPKRPSGISATDAEHQAAIDLAIQCRDWLMAMGFPASIVADSGNGAHLLFRCDLPNEPAITELFKRCLGAIAAKWDNAAVTVDRKVYNAARIWKLYGTAAAKGDDLPERPHRVARILEVPERLDVVPRETFDALAGMAAKAAPTARAGRGSDADFERTLRPVQTALDLRQWLAHHKVPVDDGRDWQGGRLYVVNPCPWNPEHTNKSAFVIQHVDGGVSAGCHHNSCSDKGWPEFRDHYEPGWREKPGELHAIEAIEDPARLARLCLERLWTHADGPTIRFHHGEWFQWEHTAYRLVPESELTARLAQTIKSDFDRKSIEAQQRKDERGAVARRVSGGLLANVRLMLQSRTIIPSAIGVPCWLDGEGPWPAREVLACPSGLYHLPALAAGVADRRDSTPRFFSTFALDFSISLDAPTPAAWHAFLEQLWPKDRQSIEALQEWMGYCLTQDTRQQKILMLIGPPRSGKGTIAHVLTRLIGQGNVTGPPFSSFKGEFGLQPLLGKTLAIVPDARLRGQSDTVVERLLSISGEDLITINRKNLAPVSVQLPTRLMLISNELPSLNDASGALVTRIIFLELTQSFLGKEDPDLRDKLIPELPGVLLWATAGWKRLTSRGRFVQPESARESLRALNELSSPVWAFVQERCNVGVFRSVPRQVLYNAYLKWCETTGRRYPDAPNIFGRNLHAAFPSIGVTQPSINGERVRCYEGIDLKTEFLV